MPEDFNKCVRNGGRVRTISGPNKRFGLKKDEYIHICFDKEGMYRGEIKKKSSRLKAISAKKS